MLFIFKFGPFEVEDFPKLSAKESASATTIFILGCY